MEMETELSALALMHSHALSGVFMQRIHVLGLQTHKDRRAI